CIENLLPGSEHRHVFLRKLKPVTDGFEPGGDTDRGTRFILGTVRGLSGERRRVRRNAYRYVAAGLVAAPVAGIHSLKGVSVPKCGEDHSARCFIQLIVMEETSALEKLLRANAIPGEENYVRAAGLAD